MNYVRTFSGGMMAITPKTKTLTAVTKRIAVSESMKLIPNKFAVAFAGAFAILWVICSATVYFLPDAMMSFTGHMMHADLSSMGWTLTGTGITVGLIAWAFCAWITAWLIAIIYNKLVD